MVSAGFLQQNTTGINFMYLHFATKYIISVVVVLYVFLRNIFWHFNINVL